MEDQFKREDEYNLGYYRRSNIMSDKTDEEILEYFRKEREPIDKPEGHKCDCLCHYHPGTLHMVACCNLTYKQFKR